VGNLPRSPRAPVGAFGPALNGPGCASPLSRAGQYMGGLVTSTVSQLNPANKAAFPFARRSASESSRRPVFGTRNSQVTALSIEFVAIPHEAHRAQLAIPPALAGAFKEVTGFAGSLVMVSGQEARLLTVLTLWSGQDRQRLCNENLRWVRALLAPYLDRCLRVQILSAHMPALAASLAPPEAADDSSPQDCLSTEEETTCVA